MPNWCSNSVVIEGHAEAVKKAYCKIVGISEDKLNEWSLENGYDENIFNRIVPMPKEIEDTEATFGEKAGVAILKGDWKKVAELDEVVELAQKVAQSEHFDSREAFIDFIEKLDVERFPEGKVLKDHLEQGRKSIELTEKYGYDNWYDWALENWGTKWDACYPWISKLYKGKVAGELGFDFNFDTAWSPAVPVFIELSKQHPEIRILHMWIEEGMAFVGAVRLQNGVEDWIYDGDISEEAAQILSEAGLDGLADKCWEFVDWASKDEELAS